MVDRTIPPSNTAIPTPPSRGESLFRKQRTLLLAADANVPEGLVHAAQTGDVRAIDQVNKRSTRYTYTPRQIRAVRNLVLKLIRSGEEADNLPALTRILHALDDSLAGRRRQEIDSRGRPADVYLAKHSDQTERRGTAGVSRALHGLQKHVIDRPKRLGAAAAVGAAAAGVVGAQTAAEHTKAGAKAAAKYGKLGAMLGVGAVVGVAGVKGAQAAVRHTKSGAKAAVKHTKAGAQAVATSATEAYGATRGAVRTGYAKGEQAVRAGYRATEDAANAGLQKAEKVLVKGYSQAADAASSAAKGAQNAAAATKRGSQAAYKKASAGVNDAAHAANSKLGSLPRLQGGTRSQRYALMEAAYAAIEGEPRPKGMKDSALKDWLQTRAIPHVQEYLVRMDQTPRAMQMIYDKDNFVGSQLGLALQEYVLNKKQTEPAAPKKPGRVAAIFNWQPRAGARR